MRTSTADPGQRTSARLREGAPSALVAGLVFAAAALDLLLLAWALAYGAREVRDGEGSITTGYNVSLSLGVTLLAALLVRWLPLPRTLRAQGQLAMLVGQALHALGHLARWYYVLPAYDDVLHFGIAAVTALLLLRLSQAWGLFPSAHATPARAAILTFLVALAVAGGWEIFEFAMDLLQGTREQDNLVDTMTDMVDGAFGGVAAALVAWRFPRPPEAPP